MGRILVHPDQLLDLSSKMMQFSNQIQELDRKLQRSFHSVSMEAKVRNNIESRLRQANSLARNIANEQNRLSKSLKKNTERFVEVDQQKLNIKINLTPQNGYQKIERALPSKEMNRQLNLLDPTKYIAPIAKLGFVGAMLKITDKNLNGLVTVEKGKLADSYNKLVTSITKGNAKWGKLGKDLPAKISNINPSIVGGDIKGSNMAKHITKNIKVFPMAGLIISSASELPTLVKNWNDNFKKYDGKETVIHNVTDTAVSVGRVVSEMGGAYAGGIAGAKVGAAIGTVIGGPPIGTAIGGVVGAVVGSTIGGSAAKDMYNGVVDNIGTTTKKLKSWFGFE